MSSFYGSSASAGGVKRFAEASLDGVGLVLSATESNTSFVDKVCNILSAEDLTITYPGIEWILFPNCLRNTYAVTGRVVMNGRIMLTSFDHLPATITGLSMSYTIFSPNTSDPTTRGFYAGNGHLDWSSIWTSFPSLTSFSLTLGTNVIGGPPDAIPAMVTSFSLTDCPSLLGSISNSIIDAWNPTPTNADFTLTLRNLSLSGEIPSTLLTPFNNAQTNGGKLQIILSQNQLTGPIPSFSYLANSGLSVLRLELQTNLLSGSIPSFPTGTMIEFADFLFIDFNSNNLTGSLPANLFQETVTLNSAQISFDNNALSGSIPIHFLSSLAWNTSTAAAPLFIFYLQNNQLSGAIPSSLLTSTLALGTPPNMDLLVKLSNNRLSGTIPRYLFYTEYTTDREYQGAASSGGKAGIDSLSNFGDTEHHRSAKRSSYYVTFNFKRLSMDLSNNELTGAIPSDLFFQSTSYPGLFSLTVALRNNSLNGTIPADLFGSIASSSLSDVVADFSSNLLSGTIPSLCGNTTRLLFSASDNHFTGGVPTSWATCNIYRIDVSYNLGLNGSLPSNLFGNTSLINRFVAFSTGFTGDLPIITSSALKSIDLARTSIAFCSFIEAETTPPLSDYSEACDFRETEACYCSSAYATCTVTCSVPLAPVQIPPIVPISPPTTKAPTPAGCSSPPPTPEFTCINGVWTASSTNVTTLTIPSNSGSIVITGNVTSSSIVFEGVIGTTIVIDGCANNLSTIVIQLTQEEVLKIGKSGSKSFTLLTQSNSSSSSGSCIGLDNVALATNIEDGCRTLSSKKVVSDDGKSLSALLSVDSSGCNRWWIILVSVVVVVVILGGVGIAVGYVLWNRHSRAKEMTALKNEKA